MMNPVIKRLRCISIWSTWAEIIKLFSCSTLLSMKLKLLINSKIAKINGNSRFKSPKPVIYPSNIYEQDKFHAQLSWHEKCFITLGPVLVLPCLKPRSGVIMNNNVE